MCDLLQLDNTIQPTEESLKTAFRKAAMKHHPDRGGDPEIFMKIKEAYESLKEHIEELNKPVQDVPTNAFYNFNGNPSYTTGGFTFTMSSTG